MMFPSPSHSVQLEHGKDPPKTIVCFLRQFHWLLVVCAKSVLDYVCDFIDVP